MLKTIIKKEMLDSILSFRFFIATLLCVVLIPLGMYVNLKEYEQRQSNYQEATKLYKEKSKNAGYQYDVQAEGYRPPSILSIFSVGLENLLPNKIITSREGIFKAYNEQGINNPQSVLFGKIDLLFNVSFVISLLAFIFTFNAITGEKEDGTLRLMMTNPIPRWKVLSAKILGNYTVLMVPFLLSIIISLLILNFSGIVPVFSMNILPHFLIILFITLLFILSQFSLGIWISTLTTRSITSIVALLFVWTILVLSFPKMTPMISEIVYPVKSREVVDLEKSILKKNFEEKKNKKLVDVYSSTMISFGFEERHEIYPRSPKITDIERTAFNKYDEQVKVIESEHQQKLNSEYKKIEEDYNNRLSSQQKFAINLSRISPVSCYTYIISEISSTGVNELNNILQNAERYQNSVKENIYDKWTVKRVGNIYSYWELTNEADRKKFSPQIPNFNFKSTTLMEAISSSWVDILLLLIFNILFFAGGYVRFLKYDVR
jgi:ABC-type transport system involved in multi-copper enzyme maturation permease subunit